MPEETDDTLAESPKDPVAGTMSPHPGQSERPGTEAEEAVREGRAPPEPGEGSTPAGERNAAFRGTGESREPPGDGPGHDTEEAAAYRENDA